MRQDHVSAFGSLGLHCGGKPRKAATAPAVRRHLLAHLIDVIDQDEGDARGLGGGCSNQKDRERGEGEQAAGEGHDDVWLLRAWHYGSKVRPRLLTRLFNGAR